MTDPGLPDLPDVPEDVPPGGDPGSVPDTEPDTEPDSDAAEDDAVDDEEAANVTAGGVLGQAGVGNS